MSACYLEEGEEGAMTTTPTASTNTTQQPLHQLLKLLLNVEKCSDECIVKDINDLAEKMLVEIEEKIGVRAEMRPMEDQGVRILKSKKLSAKKMMILERGEKVEILKIIKNNKL